MTEVTRAARVVEAGINKETMMRSPLVSYELDEIRRLDTDGFAEKQTTPLAKYRVRRALWQSIGNAGRILQRGALIREKVAHGYLITHKKDAKGLPTRWLQQSLGGGYAYIPESVLGKIALDYAEHLITLTKGSEVKVMNG